MTSNDNDAPSRRPLGRAKAKARERNAAWSLDVSTYLEQVVRLVASPDGGARERLDIALEVIQADKESAKAPDKPAGELAEELRQRCARIVARLYEMPCVLRLDGLDESGMLVLDRMLVDEVRRTGEYGKQTAESMAERARKRGAAPPVEDRDIRYAPDDQDRASPLYWWHLDKPRGLYVFAECLWIDEVKPGASKPYRASVVLSKSGDDYAKIPKVMAPASWAFGAPLTRVDANEYALEPSVTAKLLPRTAHLLPEDHSTRPHQTVLAIEIEPPESLPVMLADTQGVVLSMGAAKVALLMFVSRDLMSGRRIEISIGELSSRLAPESRRLQARDYQRTAQYLDELDRLRVFFPDDTRARLFDLRVPRTLNAARPETMVRASLSRDCAEMLSRWQGEKGNPYRGEFLINLTGMMALPMNKPTLMRHYIRAAAHWNAAFKPGGGFDKARMPARELGELAAMANAYPPGVAEYLDAKGEERKRLAPRRRELSKNLQRVRDDFDELANDRKLVVVESEGATTRKRYRLLPTAEHQEAYRLHRTEGGRPDDG